LQRPVVLSPRNISFDGNIIRGVISSHQRKKLPAVLPGRGRNQWLVAIGGRLCDVVRDYQVIQAARAHFIVPC
jgi:hypothetical protein